jgi:hypothetical protein
MIWSLGHYRNLDMTPDGRFIVFVAYTNSNSYIYPLGRPDSDDDPGELRHQQRDADELGLRLAGR